MKLVFKLRSVPNRGEINEYHYSFAFVGNDNYGNYQEFKWGLYVSYQKNTKLAKKDIKRRLTNQGAFDVALDGNDPFNFEYDVV